MSTITALEPILLVETTDSTRQSVTAALPKIRKPRLWTTFTTLIVAVIAGQLAVIAAVIVVSLGVGFAMGAIGADKLAMQQQMHETFQQPLLLLLISLIPFQLGMALVLLFAARRSKEPLKQRLGLVPQTGRIFGTLKIATIAGFTIAAAFVILIVSTFFLSPPSGNGIGAVVNDGSWWTITLVAMLLSVVPALVEESMFRGFLQRRLLERWSPAVAIGVTTLIFAALHFDSLQHIIAVVPLGLVVGLLAYRTNSTKPGMLVHALHNMAVVGIAALVKVLPLYLSQEMLGFVLLGLIGILGLIGLPAVISLLRSAKPIVTTNAAPEAVVELPSTRRGELALPSFAFDSSLAV